MVPLESTTTCPFTPYPPPMNLSFTAEIWFWKGPAPWFFVTVPEEGSSATRMAEDRKGQDMKPVYAEYGPTGS